MAWIANWNARVAGGPDLRGKRVWIIGASSGMGAALARLLDYKGAELILSARRESMLEAVAAGLSRPACILPLDVADGQSVKRAIEKMQQAGGCDMCLYAAGIYQPPAFPHFDAASQLAQIETNLGGIFHVLEGLAPQWIGRGHGTLVLFGSFTALVGARGLGAYGASKAAIHHLAESLRLELAPRGITIQRVIPGLVRTPMTSGLAQRLPFAVSAEYAARVICARLGDAGCFDIAFPRRFLWPLLLCQHLFTRRMMMRLTRLFEEKRR